MNKTTIYCSQSDGVTTVKAMTGAVAKASMWNTLTNTLRMMRYVIECYYCNGDDEGYYVDADGCKYRVKQE